MNLLTSSHYFSKDPETVIYFLPCFVVDQVQTFGDGNHSTIEVCQLDSISSVKPLEGRKPGFNNGAFIDLKGNIFNHIVVY